MGVDLTLFDSSSKRNKILVDLKKEAFKRKVYSVIDLLPKQIEALEILTSNEKEELLYGGAAGGGKSYLGCKWLLWSCLCYPGSKWFIGREELKRITQSTYITFQKVAKSEGLLLGVDYFYNGKNNYIHFPNGSRIDFLDMKYLPRDSMYERFGSLEYTGGWIEEGGEVDFGAYEKIATRIGRHLNDFYNLKGVLLITCNPKRNWMFRYFYKPHVDKTIADYRAFVKSSIEDNDKIDSGYKEKLDRLTGSDRKRLRHGEWEYDDDPSRLITNEAIESLRYNSILPKGNRMITGDIALQGSDLFVLGYWEGFRIEELIFCKKLDAKQVEDLIRKMATRNRVFSTKDMCLDTQGIGSWLTSYLKGCVSYISNQKPKKRQGDVNYGTINDQVSFLLADRINNKGMYINPDNIYEYLPEFDKLSKVSYDHVFDIFNEELQQVKTKGIEDGKARVLEKEKVKKQLQRSPDFWDMFKCREYADLKVIRYSSR